MIDLETLSTKPDCVVLSIGAVVFDLNKTYETFYHVLEIQAQIDKGRSIEESTFKWWLSQSKEAQNIFKAEKTNSIVGTLNALSMFINKVKDPNVWGNGSHFDISILENLYHQYGVKIPWKYNNVMDLRTFKRFLGKEEKMIRKGTYHNALDDALTQAEFVQICLRRHYGHNETGSKF